jgi:hypothetical protein
MAQAATTPTFQLAVTTGVVGIALSQTAQLNVLNLTPVIAGVTAVICTAQLEFYDAQGTLVKQMLVNNILPGTAASLPLKRLDITSVPPATPRAEVRGVVRTGPSPTPPPAGTAGGAPTIAFPVPLGCQVMITLEVFDDATGITHVVTTDTRPMFNFGILPLGIGGGVPRP